ncbi:ribosome biogenesis protein tsr1 [Rhodotorula toruloides]|uniref:Ribosome biogenesis protein tsr1 n=1 Tax=Rhodotorula toruloides TaxID=5286 RepID=A0A511KGC2_RHOTO|nr:ribosome biogenesis protein tsr1 [Rhodotorula toruloides]
MTAMHPPTRRQRVAAAALALVLAAEPTWASVGDRSPAYQRCTAVCRQQLCRDSPHSKPAPVPPDSQHPAPFAAYSTSLLWPCQATCSYACQQYLTDLALSHSPRPALREAEPGGALEGLPVGQQVQFHGKWPFHRLDFSSLPLVPFFPLRVLGLFLPRLQEPLSVLFSLVNLYAHYLGLRSLRALRRAGRMQEGRRLARVYELYAWTGVNAWVWSVVFHTRDVDWTERADYFAAAGTMVAGLWVAVVRIQGWYASASKGKTLAPSQRRAALAWTAALVALFLVHCAYLGLSDRFDYTYNMRFNVLVALLTIALWSLWSRAQSRLPTPSNFSRRQLSSYPSARSRFRAPHYLSPLPPLLLLPALTALELLDFAPLGPFGLRLLDAHALWHASTVPVVSLWYTFLVRDVRWIDGQGEGGDPSSVLPRVPASGGRTGTGGGEGEGEGGANSRAMSGHSHKPHLKQSNKAFKSKHASKSTLRDQAKGRTHRPNSKDPASKAAKAASQKVQAKNLKVNRRNHAKQVVRKKRELLEEQKGIFQGRNRNGERVQRVVAVVPLTEDVSSLETAEMLAQAVDGELTGTEGYRSLDVPKFHNQSLRFLLLPPASRPEALFTILDAAAAADFVIVALSSEHEVDAQGETALRCLTGLGVGGANGGIVGVVRDLPGGNPTLASSTRLSLQSFLTHFFPSIDRIHCVSSTPSSSSASTSASAMSTDSSVLSSAPTPSSEATLIVRGLCEKTPKGLRWRESRPRVLAERVAWEKNALAEPAAAEAEALNGFEGEELGTLAVEGVVRGSRMSANRLVHLQGWGDFKVEKIVLAPPARPSKRSATVLAAEPMSVDGSAPSTAPFEPISTPDDDADSLASTNVPDDDDFGLDEQTWPTEEEMASAPGAAGRGDAGEMPPPARPGTTPKLKKVAKGTSAYQAAWIIDDEEDDEELEEDDDEDDDAMREGDEGEGDEDEEETEFVDTAADETASVSARPFADLSPEQEQAQLEEYLASRAARRNVENRDDLDFPDEVDTPLHTPARERFARYRGLKSFRTSRWDPYEELPREYGRCFMLEDWKGMGRRLEKRAAEEGVEPGTRVIVYLANVPRRLIEQHNSMHPFTLFGLLKHEHKYSIMHFSIQRNTENSDTVRSKDPLVLQQGFRRFAINPIFSQHTVRNGGRGSNNVHKFERFLRHGINASIGTAYMPITFGSNSPSLLLRVPTTSADDEHASPDQHVHLIGTGTLLSSDPTRITAKRVILTGHPFKVHKKTATIRYLFFNREDVEYFKPVQLRTKGGRIGHIREPLGTHGYFKAGFDGPISQLDTVCLTLYKRCFPKWSRVWDGQPLPIVDKDQVRAQAAAKEQRIEIE